MPGNKVPNWVVQLSKVELPGLSQVITELLTLSERDDTAVADLASIALNDTAVTSKILKTANSAAFNPTQAKLSTISRSIVYLGFDQVRSIALSVLMLEKLKDGRSSAILDRIFVETLLTASFVKGLSTDRDDKEQETLFISAMLSRIGELAFWGARESPEQRMLQGALQGVEDPEERDQITSQSLGLSFTALSCGLAEAWSLSDEVIDSLSVKPKKKDSALIRLSAKLVRLPKGAERADVLSKIARFSGQPVKQVTEAFNVAESELPDITRALGIAKEVEAEVTDNTEAITVDHEKLMAVLKDLSDPANDASIDMIFKLVTEGVFQGVGLKRVGLLINIQGVFEARYTLGDATGHWGEFLKLPSTILSSAPLSQLSVKNASRLFMGSELGAAVAQQVGKGPVLVGVLAKGKRVIAIVLGDAGSGKIELGEGAQSQFAHIIMQANLRLAII